MWTQYKSVVTTSIQYHSSIGSVLLSVSRYMAQADQLDLLKLLLEVNNVKDRGWVCQQLHEHGVTTLTRFAELSKGTLREWHIYDSSVYDWALPHAQRLLEDNSHDLTAIRQELMVRVRMHYVYVCTIAE